VIKERRRNPSYLRGAAGASEEGTGLPGAARRRFAACRLHSLNGARQRGCRGVRLRGRDLPTYRRDMQ
jgi:hypothetical protein